MHLSWLAGISCAFSALVLHAKQHQWEIKVVNIARLPRYASLINPADTITTQQPTRQIGVAQYGLDQEVVWSSINAAIS